MRRKVVFMLMLALLLSACGERIDEQRQDHSVEVLQLTGTWGSEGEDSALQRDLARWYNLNLRSDRPDPGFEEAYHSILCYHEGVMGYAELPSHDLMLPIFHDGGESGLIHQATSAFPIGGAGNHAVMICREPLRLKQGDRIVICILGDRLTYQFGAEGDDTCTLICGNASYTCGRVVED